MDEAQWLKLRDAADRLHKANLALMERFAAQDPAEGTVEYEVINALADAIEGYEQLRWPI